MLSSREKAFLLAERLLAGGKPPAGLSERDQEDRFTRELAYSTVRHLTRIDWIIARCGERPVERIAPRALTALRLGVCQLLLLDSVPAYAAVSESVALARKFAPRAAGFVNWLLRRVGPEAKALPARDRFPDDESWLATCHSFPRWIVRRWLRRWGTEEAGRLLAALNEHPPPHLRVNLLRASREHLAAALAARGGRVAHGGFSPLALHVRMEASLTATEEFLGGAFYLQDESSQLAALALAPRAGERVLDACAGLGGKATQIAEVSGDAAQVLAVDGDAARLARLEENARRLGLRSISPMRGDLLDPALLAGREFDRILVDAPCSGLGTLARHPELKWVKRASDPKRLAATQLRLLLRAAELLAPGGLLCYGTCSTEPEENEEVVRRFLAERREFAIQPPSPGAILRVEELLTPEGCLQSLPHRHGIGGAFVARLRRG